MKNKDLKFDRKKHLLYSGSVEKIIRQYLEQHYPQEASALWEKCQLQYVKFLETVPFMGGKKNLQSGGFYDSVALLACYEVLPEKLSLAEFSRLCNEFFKTPPIVGHLASLNWAPVLRIGNYCASRVAQNNQKHADQWEGQYLMTVLPFDPEQGIRFRFDRCPIAEFARQHGYEALMPALCNPDYPTISAIHGELIRTTTCANGGFCDYQIVGNKSPRVREHPLFTDENGFLRNK